MFLSIILSVILVLICTAIHYSALRLTTQAVSPSRHPRRCLFVAVTLILVAHILETLIYAGGYWVAVFWFAIGELTQSQDASVPLRFMDYFYFALVNLTTLGRGDLVPSEHLRFITGISAFHGFLLITASGGYLLQVMSGKDPFR